MSAISRVASMTVHPRLKETETKGEPYCVNVEFNTYKQELKTIILLHGYMGSTEDYEPAFHRLGEKYNLIAIDLRGHGGSDAPADEMVGWMMQDMAFDILQVIELLIPQEESFSIMASSMSTAIAMELAKLSPARVEKLFLLSATSKFAIPGWVKLLLGIGRISPLKVVDTLIDAITNLLTRFANEQEKEYWEEGVARFKHIELEIHRKIFAETLSKWEVDIEAVKQPVFIMAGKQDKIVPYSDTLNLVERLPNASIMSFENEEHHLIRTQTDVVFDLISQWMDEPEQMLANLQYDEQDLQKVNGRFHISNPTHPHSAHNLIEV